MSSVGSSVESAVETRALSIVKGFVCAAKMCPHNCCRGWQIPVDERTEKNFKEMPGLRGRHLRFFLTSFRGDTVIKKIMGRCPFINSDHLCQFEANGETELMPLVCRIYPREGVKYGDFIEVTLELSCPVAAELFLKNKGRLSFVPHSHIDPFFEISNDDSAFLSYLLSEREKILDFIWEKDLPLAVTWNVLYSYISETMSLIMRNRLSEAGEVSLEEHLSAFQKKGKEALISFFSIRTIDRMILDHIDYGALFIRERVFSDLIRDYNRFFKNMPVKTIDRDFHEAVNSMCAEVPDLSKKYRSYFSYNIMQLFLLSYEDYHILKPLLFSMLYTELLMIFDLTRFLKNGTKGHFSRSAHEPKEPSSGHSLSDEIQIETLYLMESCVRHNPYLTQNLLNVMREETL